MTKTLPDWFLEKYHKTDTPAPEQRPAAPKGQSLYRQYLNLEFADTQQEREMLFGNVQESTKRRIEPTTMLRLQDRYGVETPKEHEPLTRPAVVQTAAPKPPKVESVFTDQKRFEEIIDQVPEEGRAVSFKQAFRSARGEGKAEFEYQGDRFNTREGGETEGDWLNHLKTKEVTPFVPGFERERAWEDIPEATRPPKFLSDMDREKTRRSLRAGAYRQSILPTKPESVEPAFTDVMKKHGFQAASGKGIVTEGVSTKLEGAMEHVAPIFRAAGISPEITSAKRDTKEWSLHNVGQALDLRLKNASPEAIKKLRAGFPGKPTKTYIHNEKGDLWRVGDYDYIIHGEGDHVHLHIERDIPETVDLLHQYGKDSGLQSKNIPKRRRAAYEAFLQGK